MYIHQHAAHTDSIVEPEGHKSIFKKFHKSNGF